MVLVCGVSNGVSDWVCGWWLIVVSVVVLSWWCCVLLWMSLMYVFISVLYGVVWKLLVQFGLIDVVGDILLMIVLLFVIRQNVCMILKMCDVQ